MTRIIACFALLLSAAAISLVLAAPRPHADAPSPASYAVAWTCGCGQVNPDGSSKCIRCQGGKKK